MQYEERLKSLADDKLLAGLSSIVGRRNQITAEFLAYLAELDERQCYGKARVEAAVQHERRRRAAAGSQGSSGRGLS